MSLRYNNISDLGAANLGKALGTVAQQNQKLISLNLNGNHIGNDGAEALAGVSRAPVIISRAEIMFRY